MANGKMAAAAVAMFLATVGAARSSPVTGLIFDDENAFAASHQVPGNPFADRGVGATVGVSTDTPITSFALLTFQQVTGSLKFVIYDESSSTFVYTSAAAGFGPDTFDGDGNANFTFKSSPDLSFTLLGGHTYDLGAISDVENYYAYNLGPTFAENGITSTPRNVLLQDYASPSIATVSSPDGTHGSAEFALQVENGAAVPEPSTIALVLIPAAVSLGISARARRTR